MSDEETTDFSPEIQHKRRLVHAYMLGMQDGYLNLEVNRLYATSMRLSSEEECGQYNRGYLLGYSTYMLAATAEWTRLNGANSEDLALRINSQTKGDT